MEQTNQTEILSANEDFTLHWTYIRPSFDENTVPPLNKILLFKIHDIKRDKFFVSAGYRIDKGAKWEKWKVNDSAEYRFLTHSRSKGTIKELLPGESKGENDEYLIVRAWAEMPNEEWFSLES